MSVSRQPEIELTVRPNAGVEVKKFMDAEGVTAEEGGLRVSVQPGGCSGFKYSLVIEDRAAEDDLVIAREGFNVFVDPFSAQYLNGVTIDYVTSMQGSGFTFKNPNSTGGCGCGSLFFSLKLPWLGQNFRGGERKTNFTPPPLFFWSPIYFALPRLGFC